MWKEAKGGDQTQSVLMNSEELSMGEVSKRTNAEAFSLPKETILPDQVSGLSSSSQVMEEQPSVTANSQLPIEEVYDCCICRLESPSTAERPIGAVTLLQSTSGQSLSFLSVF